MWRLPRILFLLVTYRVANLVRRLLWIVKHPPLFIASYFLLLLILYVFPGPGRVVIHDDSPVQVADLGVNFLITKEHIGVTRSEACLPGLVELNLDMKVIYDGMRHPFHYETPIPL